MRAEILILPLVLVGVVGMSWWIGLGSALGVTMVLVGVLFLAVATIGKWMEGESDPWLGRFILLAFAAKILGTMARWGMVEYLYGTSDAFSYHRAGVQFAQSWRVLEVPEIVGRSMGTRFVENVTSLLYAPYIPHILGGFFLFSFLAFVGQLLYYAAFRRALGRRGLKAYGGVIFFLPTFAFWPSSIGKDALMLLFMGLVAYGASRLFGEYRLRHIVPIGLGLWGAAVIRSHVAALIGVSIIVVLLIGRSAVWSPAVGFRRVLALGVAIAGVLAVATLFAETFGLGEGGDGLWSIDLAIEDLDPVVADIERRTGQGGSAIEGGFVQTLAQLPGAFPRVMFAPFPWQAHNLPALLAAAEGLVLLGIFLWALPAVVRLIPRMRRYPYLLMAAVYSVGFVTAFSAILNLGILTRQRAQVMALFLALCVGARALEQSGDDALVSSADRVRGFSAL